MSPTSPAQHEVSIIVLRDPEGQFFIHQRRPDKKVFPLKWGVGAGGKVEPGEAPAAAARRELLEEAGIDGAPSHRFDLTYEDGALISRMHIYELTVERSSVGFDATEWATSRWVSQAELAMLVSETDDLCPDTAAFVRRYLDG
jgi:8-oxo-dGTP pyrophosphatase MutT (NUDIX family)